MKVVDLIILLVALTIAQGEASSILDVLPVEEFENVKLMISKSAACYENAKWELTNLAAEKLNSFASCINATKDIVGFEVIGNSSYILVYTVFNTTKGLVKDMYYCVHENDGFYVISNCTISVLQASGKHWSEILQDLGKLLDDSNIVISQLYYDLKRCFGIHTTEFFIEATNVIANRCVGHPIKNL